MGMWLGVLAALAAKPNAGPVPACPSTVESLAGIDPDDSRLRGEHLIVVVKSARRIMRFRNGALMRTDGSAACWTMGLGPTPVGHKLREGDGKTPEGWYRTSDKPWSQWYAAIAVHYPNRRDADAARADGRLTVDQASQTVRALAANRKPPQTTPVGGEILIHGGGNQTDWTLGCIAMADRDIDALRATLPRSMVTDVLILP